MNKNTAKLLDAARQKVEDFDAEVSKRVIGMKNEKRFVYITLFAPGRNNHLLMESVPGVGKTLLGRTVAEASSVKFSHIQFQPDMLPGDIRGMEMKDRDTNEWKFYPGPVFANIILGDELNRASPKTASALLGPMEELVVTTSFCGTFNLDPPFVVLGTQNPTGPDTNPLPEAQRDRFLMRIGINYLSVEDTVTVLEGDEMVLVSGLLSTNTKPGKKNIDEVVDKIVASTPINEVIDGNDILEIRDLINKHIYVDPEMKENIALLVDLTRPIDERKVVGGKVVTGGSMRPSLAIQRAAKANAFLQGRGSVIPQDVIEFAYHTLNHRIEYDEGVDPSEEPQILEEALSSIFLKIFGWDDAYVHPDSS